MWYNSLLQKIQSSSTLLREPQSFSHDIIIIIIIIIINSSSSGSSDN